ncbi:sodium channel protein Nach-like isoform X2 [Zootermopsis nevadensis]|uniref:sodium channel protein Nach-like isoform X2 n=1 Tax=Zootermopsis nevadensis TaxID=136037 RepID=UPI000B8E690C|nr:sodium channel protein Nach-like isoform X2 [Zootermopsis nevadensis]
MLSADTLVFRTLWTLMCAMGLVGAVVLINKVWTQYSTSPTITSIESTHYPIWNIPFPAVTICQVNKVHLSAAEALYRDEFSEILDEKEYWAFVSQMAEIIQPEGVDMFQMDMVHIHAVLKNRSFDVESLMRQLTQPCSSLLIKCKWRGEVTDCGSLFTMHKTDAGFCCSFNYNPPGASTGKNDVPLRVNGAGYLTGLSMLIDPRLEDYYAALFSFYGIQVLVHANQDYPEISARGILLSPRKEAFLQVSAASTYSTKEVRDLSRQQRQCLFEDEQSLGNSSDSTRPIHGGYSYSNCLVQCRVEHMDRLCQCAPYFYPTGNNTRLCGLTDVGCLADHRRVFNNLRSPNFVPGLDDNDNAMECNCHPTCTDVTYSTEISESTFFKSEYDQTNFFKEVLITNHSILHVYFKDLSVLRFRRDVIYSWNDLLASFGGIVGLTLGSSLLSFVEILYFFTVRPACTLLRRDAVEPFKVIQGPKKSLIQPPYDWVF